VSAPAVTIRYADVLEAIGQARAAVERARQQIDALGVVGVFLPGLHSFKAADKLQESAQELQRMQGVVEAVAR
jgi:hypothetical protein